LPHRNGLSISVQRAFRRQAAFSRKSKREDDEMDILIAAALAFAAFVYAAVPDAGTPKPSDPMEDAQPADDIDAAQTVDA